MLKAIKFAAVFAVAISTLAVAGLFVGNKTYAATDIPIEIIPRCSSAAYQLSYYEVDNKNDSNVTVIYTNAANNATGTFTATPGTSALYVPYDTTDPNNTTAFTYQGQTTQTNANVGTSCDASQLPTQPTNPVTPACTDASIASNLKVVWNNDSQIAITTKSGLPICNTVDLFYSTYQMPDNYDDNGFYNADGTVNQTAIPQTGQLHYEFLLKAGDLGTWLENVPAPNYCQNTQADLYYGPEVTNIGGDGLGYHADGTPVQTNQYAPAGHGVQNIASAIFLKDASQCTGTPGQGGGNGGDNNGGGSTGGNGGSTTTPTMPGSGSGTGTVTTPATTVSSTPTVLPDTGIADTTLNQNMLSALLSILFGGTSLMAIGLRALRG